MGFYPLKVGDTPYITDINQLIDALSGKVDVGNVTLAQPIATPTGGQATAVNGAGMSVGTYQYQYTYVTGVLRADGTAYETGETLASPVMSVATTTSYQNVSLTGMHYPSAGQAVMYKRIYRTEVNGSTFWKVTDIAATSTSFTDTIADGTITAIEKHPPTDNNTGTFLVVTPVDRLPTPGLVGRILRYTVDGAVYMDTGTQWQAVFDYNAVSQLRINLIDLSLEVETLKGATLNGVSANMWVDALNTQNDINLAKGVYNATAKRVEI